VKAETVRTVPIGDLVPDAANVRRRDDRAKGALEASVRQFGPARSIVIDSRDIVRAGNGTLEAFQAAGGTVVLVVKPGPNQLVAVQRDDWSRTEAVGYSLADNRVGELADWDYQGLGDVIRALEADKFDVSTLGWQPHELEPILAADWAPVELGELPSAGGSEPDQDNEHGHAVRFDAACWETVGAAIAERRELAQNAELTEAQCLELICADFLVPRSD